MADVMHWGDNELMNEVRMNFDAHDAWGCTLVASFAIAETLYVAGEDVPAAWDFRPSPLVQVGDWGYIEVEHEYLGEIIREMIADDRADDVLHVGNVVDRYLAILRSHGRDY